ncbi:integrase, catalytic region, zinc finger, CCHC-type containing protein [Tanacetum coccineum]
MCVVKYLNDVNAHARAKSVKSIKKYKWKPTGKVFIDVGHRWFPTGRTFNIVGNKCSLSRITSTKIVPLRKSVKSTKIMKIPPNSVSQWKTKETINVCSSSEPKIVESRPSNNSEPNRNWGSIVSHSLSSYRFQCRSFKSSFGTVRFGNDQVAVIMGYGDYEIRNVTISRVHGVDLLKGPRVTNLYTISLEDMQKSSPICLLSKASKTKSWLWHRRLSHLNFDTINQLAKEGLVRANTNDTPLLTIIDQDTPSASTLPRIEETQALVIHQDVKEQQQGNQNRQFDNDPFINIFTLEPSSKESASRDVIPSNLHQTNQPFDHLRK